MANVKTSLAIYHTSPTSPPPIFSWDKKLWRHVMDRPVYPAREIPLTYPVSSAIIEVIEGGLMGLEHQKLKCFFILPTSH